MAEQQHPMEPSVEIVHNFWSLPQSEEERIAAAYRAGAERQLNADCDWLDNTCCDNWDEVAAELRAAMRPKPPSLAEQALSDLDVLLGIAKREGVFNPPDTIRAALERLQELEQGNE